MNNTQREFFRIIERCDNLTEEDLFVLFNRTKGKTLTVVGNYIGKTRETVRQIEFKALRKIRYQLRKI